MLRSYFSGCDKATVMKRHWKIIIGLMAAGILAALALSRQTSREQHALEETRQDLRAHGFKIDLAAFDFSASEALQSRATALTNASFYTVPRNHEDAARRSLLQQIMPEFMQTIGADAALPIWKQETWAIDAGTVTYLRLAELPNDLWPALRAGFADDREILDVACTAALAGPIRFHLDASRGHAMLLPHLAALKNLSQTLSGRALLELHDGRLDAAWTNVLAATRLVTAWEVEPVEISQLVRASCVTPAFNIIWQALQTNGWSEAQLDQLQREWEAVDFFKSLPETTAFARAAGADSFQRERTEPMIDLGAWLKDFFQSPKQAWANLRYWQQQLQYRQRGCYEDEKDFLLFYRDREEQLRQAVMAQTWVAMKQLPGVTNATPFTSSRGPSRTLSMLNMRQLTMSFQGQGQGLPSRVAKAEARRRLIMTAIALERFHRRHGNYPPSLAELTPEFLNRPPVDFMDGQPLRYRLTEDRHFVLYSVGLDGVDHGGKWQSPQQNERPYPRPYEPYEFGLKPEPDLIWPRPAADADVQAFHREQLRTLIEQATREQELQAEAQWSNTAERQAQAAQILAAKSPEAATEPTYRGRPLVEMVGNKSVLGTNTPKWHELLMLRPTVTSAEPEIVTFTVPLAYDVVTNLGQLVLLIDPSSNEADEEFIETAQAGWLELHRATNGNCLLRWNTIYEAPGLHALQLAWAWNDPATDDEALTSGALASFTVSNLCQFSLSSAYFKPELGATLRAKLTEPNAIYSLEITSPTGEQLKTITSSTTNGLMTIHWDLVDDHGIRRTNSSFNTLIKVNLLDSGRTQTLRGP